jgi:hypothetical protein
LRDLNQPGSDVDGFDDDEMDGDFPVGAVRKMLRDGFKKKVICEKLHIAPRTLSRKLPDYGLVKPTHADGSTAWIAIIKEIAAKKLTTRKKLLRVAQKLHPKLLPMSAFDRILQQNEIHMRDKTSEDKVYDVCAAAVQQLHPESGIRTVQMHIKKETALRVSQFRVMHALRDVDPDGVKLRSKGIGNVFVK